MLTARELLWGLRALLLHAFAVLIVNSPSFFLPPPSEVTNRDVVDALNAMRTSLLTTNDSGGAETMYGGGLGGMLDYLS